MTNLLVLGLLILILGAVIFYIVRAKRSGVRCIGCPDGGKCSSANLKAGENKTCCCEKNPLEEES